LLAESRSQFHISSDNSEAVNNYTNRTVSRELTAITVLTASGLWGATEAAFAATGGYATLQSIALWAGSMKAAKALVAIAPVAAVGAAILDGTIVRNRITVTFSASRRPNGDVWVRVSTTNAPLTASKRRSEVRWAMDGRVTARTSDNLRRYESSGRVRADGYFSRRWIIDNNTDATMINARFYFMGNATTDNTSIAVRIPPR